MRIRSKIQLRSRSYMCRKEAESNRHLFLHCEVTQTYRTCFFAQLISNGPPLSVKNAYENWSQWKVDKAIKRPRTWFLLCIFWCMMWLERNRRCFDREPTPLGLLKARCISNLFGWSNLHPAINAEHLLDFISSVVLA